MKCKNVILSILIAVLLLPIVAFAQTQEEWNLSCNNKTSCSTTVYKTDAKHEVKETIPANTYVKIQGSGTDGMCVITYMLNGRKSTGLVQRSNLIGCSSQVRGSNGIADNVHELDPNHDKILQGGEVVSVAESVLLNGTTDYSGLNFTTDMAAEHVAQATAGRSSSTSSSSQPKGNETPNDPEETAATRGNVQVTLEQLGSTTSKVRYNGTTTEVNTADLVFSSDVPEDKRIAVVYAPNTGKASLRAKASSSADVLKKCKAGTIVSVLEYGKKFCKINYNGSVGYILTSCLQFISPDEQSVGTGVLTYKGKATGRTTINVRNDADGDSAKITEWRTGTEVLVFGKEGKWYEVEANGMRGFVKEEFLTMNEE